MNLSFSTLGCTDASLQEILTTCQKYGISLLEIRGIAGEMDITKMPEFSKEQIEKTKEQFRSAGVKPIVLGTSCKFHTEDRKQRALVEGSVALEYAEAIGAKGIRVFGNELTDDPQTATRLVIEGISELCKKAANTNVKVLLEVHGDFNTVEVLSPILNALKDEPHFGLLWDLAHTNGTYGKDWMRFYTAVKPFIAHVHVKDANNDGLTMIGEGTIPIVPIVKQLLSDGYTGAFSLEWEKKWHPELPDFEIALQKYVSLMEQIK